MTRDDIAQSAPGTLPACPVMRAGLCACSAAMNCPRRAECTEKEKTLDAILVRIARGEI